jgi:hypothetical protein
VVQLIEHLLDQIYCSRVGFGDACHYRFFVTQQFVESPARLGSGIIEHAVNMTKQRCGVLLGVAVVPAPNYGRAKA